MASSNLTVTTPIATIESDSTPRTVTLASGQQMVLTNTGTTNAARIGVAGETLAVETSGTNDDGQCTLGVGESIVLPRGLASFLHKSTAGTTLRLVCGAG